MRRVRALLAALLLGLPLAVPAPVAAIGPLPECRLDNIPTVPRGYEDGPITLVDHLLTVGKDYVPPDLIPVGEMGLAGGGLIRRIAAKDTRAMARAARENGTPIGVWSGYRSARTQKILYRGGVATYGVKIASRAWARPGHSEHQLGLGVDFMTAGGGNPLIGDWSTTPAGAWMQEHAWEYGWVMSYPKGLRRITCFHYEPWHYRYVGRDVARAIHESGLTIREYLWANVTQVELPTGEPSPSPSGTAPSTPSPTTPAQTSPPDPSPSPQTASPPPAASPAPTPADPGDAGSPIGGPLIAGLVLVLGALALVAYGLGRRPARR